MSSRSKKKRGADGGSGRGGAEVDLDSETELLINSEEKEHGQHHEEESEGDQMCEEDRTIISQLEKDGESELDNNDCWEEIDETSNLIPEGKDSGGKTRVGQGRSGKTAKGSRSETKEGKWVRIKGRNNNSSSFRWVAKGPKFDKRAGTILRRFWLHEALLPKDKASDWDGMMTMGCDALETIQEMFEASTGFGINPSSVKVSKIDNDVVYLRHLMSLRKAEWVHSSIINAWSALIAKEAGHVCFSTKPLLVHLSRIMDTGFYDQLAGIRRDRSGNVTSIDGYSEETARRISRNNDLRKLERIAIPINQDNTHWISACFIRETNTINICCSLLARYPLVEQHLSCWIKDAVTMEDKDPIIVYEPIEKQIGDDCRVATVLHTAKSVLVLDGLPPMREATKLRGFLAGSIMTGKLRIGKPSKNKDVDRTEQGKELVTCSDTQKGSSSVKCNKQHHTGHRASQEKEGIDEEGQKIDGRRDGHQQAEPKEDEEGEKGIEKGLKEKSKQPDKEKIDRMDELMKDEALFQRFLGVLEKRIAAGEEAANVVDEVVEGGDLLYWCAKHEEMTWAPITFTDKPGEKESLEGRGFLIASVQTGPKGGRFAVNSIVDYLNEKRPAVMHCQELRTPRHKVARLKKSIKFGNKEYAIFTSVSSEACKVAGAHLGVATLVRVDLTDSIRRISLPEEVDGRVLALLIGGHAAAQKTLHVNVYQHVNKKVNYGSMYSVLDNVYKLVRWAKELGHNMVLCCDLNATLYDSLRINYSEEGEWVAGDKLLRECYRATGATCASKHTEITWKSKTGQQQSTLDHIWHWPPTLRENGAGVIWREDSRFDHGVRWAEYDGNDIGFGVDRDEDRAPFIPKLKLAKWSEHKEEIHEAGVSLGAKRVSKEGGWDGEETAAAKWVRLRESLGIFKDAAGEISGMTKPPTGRPDMRLPGHAKLHQEIQRVRDIRKDIFEAQKGKLSEELPKLRSLYDKLRASLKGSDMTVPPATTTINRKALQEETAFLIKEREDRVDEETQVKRNENFKELAKRLQGTFNSGGAKTIKVVTGKMSGNRGMWGVHTDQPDQVVVEGLVDSTPNIGVMIEEGKVVQSLREGSTVFQTVRLRDMLPLLEECFSRWPEGTTLESSRDRIVTDTCDKLCAQEWFLGNNAMSKQAGCHSCGSKCVQTMSKIDSEGKREWGAVCEKGHWGLTVNPKRDFSTDEYGRESYRIRRVDKETTMSIKGSVKRKDFEWLIQNLPNWKAPGDDLIPNELLKAAPPWLMDELYSAVDYVLRGGKLPKEWKYALIKLLEKKALASHMTNQRPVCCARTVYKLVSYFVTSRMTRMIEHYWVLEESQEGFRSARSCQRQAARYVDIIQDAKKNKKQLYCLYIDWGNAFNSIDQDVLWRAMELAGFREDDVDILKEMYKDSSFAVENPFGTTAPIPCKCGTKQGDIVSPIIFSLAMNVLLRQLAARGGGYTHSSGERFNVMAFADDLILISEDAGKMQALVDEVQRFADWSGMWVNVGKSNITAFDFAKGEEPRTDHIRYKGKSFTYLAHTDHYKYLGFNISLSLDWSFHKAAVRDKITETIDHLRDTIYRYGQVESMVRVCVVPLFRYSASLVPWTESELQSISRQLGIAMKHAWKVSAQCGRAVLTAGHEEGGWASPLAEVYSLQEQWGLFNQSFNHDDSLSRMVRWKLQDLMKENGCCSVRELQMELRLSRKDTTWIELLLSQSALLEIFFSSQLDTETNGLSLRSLTYDERVKWNRQRWDQIEERKGMSKEERRTKRGDLHRLSKKIGDTQLALMQLHERGIFSLQQLITADDGTVAGRHGVPGTGTLNEKGYKELRDILERSSPVEQRRNLFGSNQPSVQSFFQKEAGAAPQRMPAKLTELRGSAAWQKQKRGRRKRSWKRDRGKAHYRSEEQDEAVERDRIMVVQELSEDGSLARCSFDQRIREDLRGRHALSVTTMDLVESMVRNRATLNIPDISLYWPEQAGSVRARVEGFRQFPGKGIGRVYEYYGFIISIVDSEVTEEIGCRIDTGLRALGKRGVLESLRGSTFEEACWREDEWVPTWMLGVNQDPLDEIIQPLWKLLHSSRGGRGGFLDEEPKVLNHKGDRAPLMRSQRRRQVQGCGLCKRYKQAWGEKVKCDVCTARTETTEEGGREEVGHRPEVRIWQGGAMASSTARSQLAGAICPEDIQETDSAGRVTFDYSSIQPRTLIEGLDGDRMTTCSSRVSIWSKGKKTGSFPEPMFHATVAWGEKRDLQEWNRLIKEAEGVEAFGHRIPGWHTQEALAGVDGADLILGIPTLGLSPRLTEGWCNIDPDQWTEAQRDRFEAAGSGVLFLHGRAEQQEQIISRLRGVSREARWIVVTPGSYKPTVSQLHTNSLLVFGRRVIRWTAKVPLWQGKCQWKTQPGYIQKGGVSSGVFSTGPSDWERAQALSKVCLGAGRNNTEEEWVGQRAESTLMQREYLGHVEARKYEGGDHILAATDGSVRQSDGAMGAGVAFYRYNDAEHLEPLNCAVGGEAASLRAEAVALDLLLDHTSQDRKLVVLTDSLSLMRILDGWDKRDFIPRADRQKHKDVITALAIKLANRRGETVMVKVKSHTGVSLNEEADQEAAKGVQSDYVRAVPSSPKNSLLTPVDASGERILDFNKTVRKRWTRRANDVDRTKGGLTAESFLLEDRGQHLLFSTRGSLPEKLARRMLQLFGGVFPCGMRSYRIGRAESGKCALCGVLETPSHILCGCKELAEAVTAAHDKIWRSLFEYLKDRLQGTSFHYDQALGSMKIQGLSEPIRGKTGKYKPDGVAEGGGDKECFLLEFTRTSDFWPTSLEISRVRKHDKEGYKQMLEKLRDGLPGWRVELLTFVLGDRGLFDVALWSQHLSLLGLNERDQRGFMQLAQTGAYEVIEDILTVRSARIRTMGQRIM